MGQRDRRLVPRLLELTAAEKPAISDSKSRQFIVGLTGGIESSGIAFSLIQNLDDIANDEHLKAVGVIVPTASDNPDYQWTVSSPIEMAGEEKLPPKEAPDIGAHSHEILTGLGYSDDDINRLSEAGVTRL